MWDRIDLLLERAPHEDALRIHRVELLEARRRRANGLGVGSLGVDEMTSVIRNLAVVPLLERVRAAWDGPILLHKGPEAAFDYPGPRMRRFWDLDLLTDDAKRAHAALLAAGFEEIDGEESEHHLPTLGLTGLPLGVEMHSQLNWVERLPAPTTDELLAMAVPARLGIDGVLTLPPAQHALVLAAHAWSHDELGRLGNLIDVAATLQRTDATEVASVARRWGCSRLWRTTANAIGAVLEGSSRSAAVTVWARHLRDVRERTVLEWHTKRVLSPMWGLSRRRILAAIAAEARATVAPESRETWQGKLHRTGLAVRNAGNARSDHLLALRAHDDGPIHRPNTR